MSRPESPEHEKNTLKYEMTQMTPAMIEDPLHNPVYDQVSPAHATQQQQQENSLSNSSINNTSVHVAPNPVYGVDSRSHRSTIRLVENPVYGDTTDSAVDTDVYSSPDQLPMEPNADNSGEVEYSYALVDTSAKSVTNQARAPQQKMGTSPSTEALVMHEYAMVDKSKKTRNIAALSSDQVAPPYERLQHEQGSTEQGQAQDVVRLAENEDFGYSALT